MGPVSGKAGIHSDSRAHSQVRERPMMSRTWGSDPRVTKQERRPWYLAVGHLSSWAKWSVQDVRSQMLLDIWGSRVEPQSMALTLAVALFPGTPCMWVSGWPLLYAAMQELWVPEECKAFHHEWLQNHRRCPNPQMLAHPYKSSQYCLASYTHLLMYFKSSVIYR